MNNSEVEKRYTSDLKRILLPVSSNAGVHRQQGLCSQILHIAQITSLKQIFLTLYDYCNSVSTGKTSLIDLSAQSQVLSCPNSKVFLRQGFPHQQAKNSLHSHSIIHSSSSTRATVYGSAPLRNAPLRNLLVQLSSGNACIWTAILHTGQILCKATT